MQTANFVTASAEVTSITTLKKGDVYKRLETSDYSGDSIIHGIVLEVLYNGTDAAIECMEFTTGYQSLNTKFKVFAGGKDIKIFPSSQEQVQEYLKDCVSSIERELKDSEKNVLDTQEKLTQAKRIVSGDLVKNLSTPDFSDKLVAETAHTK